MPHSSTAEPETIPAPDSAPPAGGRGRLGANAVLGAFVVLLGLYAFQLWLHATRTSATYDEPVHILAGYRYWQCGDFAVNPEHPPLLKLLAALPLMAGGFAPPAAPCGAKVTPKAEASSSGAQFLARNGAGRMLTPSRLAAAVFSLLLAVLVFLAARDMFGDAEALVALALLAFEPNLVAHGSLVTTDMAVTALAFAAVYALYRYRRRPRALNLLPAGLAVGLMLASKHSGLLMLPILFVLMVADALLVRGGGTANGAPAGRRLLQAVVGSACILLVGLCVLWSSYGFRYQALPGAGALSPNDLLGAHAGAPVARALLFAQRLHVLPEAYTYGLADIVAEGQRDTFLLGRVYPRGQWFYFPVAFAIKTSVALLVSLAIAAAAAGLYRGRRRELLFLLLPPLCFLAVSLTSGINIGVRHILPVYPFCAVVAAAGCCALARRRRAFAYALAALLLFHAAAAARTAPHYIAFANDFWGGTDNTYRLLHDSNVDWGQGLKLADEYVRKEGTGECWFAYFGQAALAREHQRCHIMPAPLWTSAPEPLVEPVPPVIEGTLLVSAQALPPHYEAYEPLAGVKPVAILGGAVLVYRGRFELPLAAALSYSGRASQLARQGRGEEAVADGRRAVELAPDNPRTHMQLAQVLVDTGRRDEARRELESVIHLAESGPPSFQTVGRRARQLLQRLR